MESLQPSRPPLSQQPPPQRIDTDRRSNSNNDSDPSQSAVNISLAYKRKKVKHRIECDKRVKTGASEVSELRSILGPRKCQMYKKDAITACVVCDEQCVNGKFAVETVLFIPNKGTSYDHLGRFRTELPRIACLECSAEYASINAVNDLITNEAQLSLGQTWTNYINASTKSMQQKPAIVSDKEDEKQQVPMASAQALNTPSMQMSEAERDPFDDGFLICTQLVKTGGADQGGLQVGDVFVEFGHYSKHKFPGLKSVANMVRRSAGKEINVVVWRKLEQMNAEDDGTGRTVFQKLALKLKPLQSHDADGGGVLGAVINTYPLPEMKN